MGRCLAPLILISYLFYPLAKTWRRKLECCVLTLTLAFSFRSLFRTTAGRVAIFIDGANLFYAALQMGIEIDYTRLLKTLTGRSPLLRSFFYTGVDRNNEKQQGFLLWMRRNGFRVVTKELTQLPDGSKRANLDVEIAVDMLSLVRWYETAVLVSGDGDLAYAVNAVSYQGARVEVVSLRSMTSDQLINLADRYIDLESIKDYIKKTNRSSYLYRGGVSNDEEDEG
jgi:uncharacterized LabA/DUF88 family protein